MEIVRDNKRVLITGQNHYRSIEPYTTIECDGIDFVLIDENTSRDDTDRYDAVFIPMPVDTNLPDAIKEFKKNGIKVIVDVDDDLFSIPASNTAFKEARTNKMLDRYTDCLHLCDYIHTSTPELFKTLHQDKTTVFGNALNLDKYTSDKSDIEKRFRESNKIPDENKIVMWSGSPTHVSDIGLLYHVFNFLLKRGDVTLVLSSQLDWLRDIGFKAEETPNLITLGWMPFDIYPVLMAISNVSLCPLVNNRFNSCKSELKILESAIWKIPSVTSNVDPYNRFYNLSCGGSVPVKKERLEQWLKAIDYALSDMGKEVGEKAYLCVKENYDLKKINQKRINWWRQVLK